MKPDESPEIIAPSSRPESGLETESTSIGGRTEVEEKAAKLVEANVGSSTGATAQMPPPVLPAPVSDDSTNSVDDSNPPPAVGDGQRVTGVPAIADDSDLIEKEWVYRAKHIVEQTKNDPFVQNREVNKMKAEYVKKRYGKDIKLAQ